MKRLIIVGSPRTNGRSAHLAELLFETNIDEHPEDELFLVPVSEIEVAPCIGCEGCREKSPVIYKSDTGEETSELRNRCVFDDDMQTLYDLLDDTDELVIVSPVYFSGAPAPLKCLLDRLQPYYWNSEKDDAKRPAILHVIGEGGDPHGYDALVSEVRSSTALAGFRLEKILDWVGKISPEGEITSEATEINADRKATKIRPKLDLHSSDLADDLEQDSRAQKEKKGNTVGQSTGKSGKQAGKKPDKQANRKTTKEPLRKTSNPPLRQNGKQSNQKSARKSGGQSGKRRRNG